MLSTDQFMIIHIDGHDIGICLYKMNSDLQIKHNNIDKKSAAK